VLALRPLGNELILMVKSSALASIVTIFDLMGATKLAFSRSYNFDVYLWAAIIYLCLTEFIRVMLMRINARLTRHLTQDN
jgi:polar amino acid transport system permease protein